MSGWHFGGAKYLPAGTEGPVRARSITENNVHHGSLAADQMPWKPHLPTALAPVTVSLLSLPIVSSGSSLEDAIKLRLGNKVKARNLGLPDPLSRSLVLVCALSLGVCVLTLPFTKYNAEEEQDPVHFEQDPVHLRAGSSHCRLPRRGCSPDPHIVAEE